MEKKIFGCGWKMYLSDNEAKDLALKIKNLKLKNDKVELFVLPSLTAIKDVLLILNESGVKVGAQNGWYEDNGAFTGEVSIKELVKIGVEYIEVGHAERKKYFAETNSVINKKLKAIIRYGKIPIFCIGENQDEKEKGLSEEILQLQLKEALYGITINDAKKIIFAYEPVWAIGTKDSADQKYIEYMHTFIKNYINKIYGKNDEKFIILYGGSVSVENIRKIINTNNVSGVFVGRSGLNIEDYTIMYNEIYKSIN